MKNKAAEVDSFITQVDAFIQKRDEERRKYPRQPLETDVSYRLYFTEQNTLDKKIHLGYLRDISRNGMHFTGGDAIAPGQTLCIAVGGKIKSKLAAKVRLVRCSELTSGRYSFGAIIEEILHPKK